MKDQEIYTTIGQILYDEVGNIDDYISLSACAVADQNSVDTSVWKGEYLDASSSVRLSNKASFEIHRLVVQLKKYFETESMGIWNLILYKLAPHGKSFSIDFEFSEDVEKGKMTLYRYRERYRRPKS